ncbi:MAG TPA: hypothetical protein VFU15_14245, partial [Bacteroidia bacterium]|nr:hypothetical protein [Bacteroidia bacterium]
LFQGFLELIPIIGPAIFDKLVESGLIVRAGAWLDSVLGQLGLSLASIRDTFSRCWDEMGITHGISGNIAIIHRYFDPIVNRISNFARQVINRVVQFLRETLFTPLNNFLSEIPGWSLFTTILGRNPLTNQAVPRTALNLVRGFMEFIPGGTEKLDQLVQSHALERAYQWFLDETHARNLTWERISATFSRAWDSLDATSILHPIDTFRNLSNIFSPLLRDLLGFAVAALEKILEFIFEAAMGAGGARILSILRRVRSTFLLIIRNPVGFLSNLVTAIGRGVRQFMQHILVHLRNGVIEWLTGGLTRAGVQLPEQWDLRGFLFFVLQILGLTWDNIRQRLVTLLGERTVSLLERGFQFLQEVREKGFVEAIKDRISEFFGNIREMVLNRIKEWIQQRIVMAAITQLLSLLSPVGAVIQAILKTYNTIMFFIERMNQILAFVESIVDSITNIAMGSLGQAANYIEQSMARFIPVMLSFLARFIGIGDIAAPIQRAIQAIQAGVNRALDRIVAWIQTAAQRLMQAGRSAVGAVASWLGLRKEFRTNDHASHSLFVEDHGGRPTLMIASEKQPFSQYLNNLTVPASDSAKRRAKQNAITSHSNISTKLNELKTMEAAPSTPRGNLTAKQNEIRSEYDTLSDSVTVLGIGGSRSETVQTTITPTGGSKLTHIQARPLTALRGNTVGNPNANSVTGVPGWSFLDRINIARGNDNTIYNDWVRWHLIHSSMHGPASIFNLVAAPRVVNTRFAGQVEHPVLRRLLEPGTMLYYDVDIAYGNSAAPLNDFPTSITYVWGTMKMDDNNRPVDDQQIDRKEYNGFPLPAMPTSGGPLTVRLKNIGRPFLQTNLRIPQDRARRIAAACSAYSSLDVYSAMNTYYALPTSSFNGTPYSNFLSSDKASIVAAQARFAGTYIIDLT